MRTLSRTLGVAILATLLVFQTACDTSDLDRIVQAIESSGVDPGDIATLVQKFKDNPSAGALDAITRAFDVAVTKAEQIANPTKRTLALVALDVGNWALRRVIDKFLAEAQKAPSSMRQSARSTIVRLEAVRARATWHCRSSQTGQWQKMGYCKAHPDVSTVERF